jgi:hypothetical protein
MYSFYITINLLAYKMSQNFKTFKYIDTHFENFRITSRESIFSILCYTYFTVAFNSFANSTCLCLIFDIPLPSACQHQNS